MGYKVLFYLNLGCAVLNILSFLSTGAAFSLAVFALNCYAVFRLRHYT